MMQQSQSKSQPMPLPLGGGWWLEQATDQELAVANSAGAGLEGMAYILRGQKCAASVLTLADPWQGVTDPHYWLN